MMVNKEHLHLEGLLKILSIKASHNLGISDKLRTNFPNIVPIKRPFVLNQKIQDPN
jgi:hypothetical protein